MFYVFLLFLNLLFGVFIAEKLDVILINSISSKMCLNIYPIFLKIIFIFETVVFVLIFSISLWSLLFKQSTVISFILTTADDNYGLNLLKILLFNFVLTLGNIDILIIEELLLCLHWLGYF